MSTKTTLCRFLKDWHTGQEKAVHSYELERLFNLDGRALRTIIYRLRREGHPICSSQNGYYYAKNRAELDQTVRRLMSMSDNLKNTCHTMLFAYVFPDEFTPNSAKRNF